MLRTTSLFLKESVFSFLFQAFRSSYRGVSSLYQYFSYFKLPHTHTHAREIHFLRDMSTKLQRMTDKLISKS